jgi:hypothetical protein
MYLQLFKPLKWLRWACYIGLFVNWAFYISKAICAIYFMVPNPGQSWAEALSNPRHIHAMDMSIPIASGSLILDVYIFIIPMIVLSGLQLTRRRKFQLAAVFGTGAL